MLTAEEIKRRLIIALWEDDDCEDWLERAEDACHAVVAWSQARKSPRPVDTSTFGGRVRFAREICGMSMNELGGRLGVHSMRVNDWEKGRGDFPAEKLPGMAMSLGVTRAWLLGESEEGGPPMPSKILRAIRSPGYWRYWRARHRWAEKRRAKDREAAKRARYAGTPKAAQKPQ